MNVDVVIKEMTVEEKASLCSGSDSWHTKSIERLDIPRIMVADGPHGLRKVKDDTDVMNQSIEAVCFPSACATACSFDRELVSSLGKALGQACKAEKVAVLLGPGCNIKRSPLCGRNFEYFSEDPYLASQIAAAHIKGVQSMGIGTSLKHFACNNQETRRMTCSANMDERTFFEIYAAAFEGAVKEAKPYTVMCSYNKINNVYSSENKFLLTDVLREKWGYDGLVMSDWGAVNNRTEGIKAGLDLEMPSSHGVNDAKIVESIKNGTLDEKLLDKAVRNVLELVNKAENGACEDAQWDMQAQHLLARKIASECAVLLKNDSSLLPLDTSQKIAFIGDFAQSPRYQGGGSSHINSFKVTSALQAVKDYCEVDFAKGYDSNTDAPNDELIAQAVECAKQNDVAVVFVGLTDMYESEGFDRKHMRIPDNQLLLIDKVCEVCENVVVVLHNGSPVEMPFSHKVKSILDMYLGGQAVGGATCDLLFGKVNPSGKLAETFPEKLSDNPSYLSFPGEKDDVKYREGVFVGYRYYDYKDIKPLYPFGHGLSYTSFEYSDLEVSSNAVSADDGLTVTVKIKNTGDLEGKEVVQLYVSDKESTVIRPIRELKGFEKISLRPGESKKVMFKLDRRAFAFYSETAHDWVVEEGDFVISVGASSRDIRANAEIYVSSNDRIPVTFTPNSPICDFFADPLGREKFGALIDRINKDMKSAQPEDSLGATTDLMTQAMLREMPIRAILSFTGEALISYDALERMICELNEDIKNKYR